jgi:hypothetical protein
MPLARVIASSVALFVAAGCSPYVYKQEIDGFATGVKDLATAYNDGRTFVAARDTDDVDAKWTQARAPLTIAACEFRDSGSPGTVECVLHQVAQPVPGPSPLAVAVRDAAPVVKALSDYSSALAAVANAADREALTAAQAKFKTAVQGLAKEAAGTTVPAVGPAVDLFSALTAALLDQQRYDILRSGVGAARVPVADLGNALAGTLGGIWMVRASELRDAANVEVRNLGTGADYAARLKKARERVAALEALRAKNPAAAATGMVAAHDALAKALADDSRQVEAVATAVGAFATQAKAVKDAFAK